MLLTTAASSHSPQFINPYAAVCFAVMAGAARRFGRRALCRIRLRAVQPSAAT